jgi:hypothetical protein
MAHANLESRRNEIGRLIRYKIRFEPMVVAALAREFNCSISTIRADIRFVRSDSRAPLDSLWRPNGDRSAAGIGGSCL